jgi:hypothetical protein
MDDSVKSAEELAQAAQPQQPQQPKQPTDAEIAKLTAEVMAEPLFELLGRLGQRVMGDSRDISGCVETILVRCWPKGGGEDANPMVMRLANEIDERLRDIDDRIQRIGIYASRSKAGAEAFMALQAQKEQAAKDKAAGSPEVKIDLKLVP